MGSESILLPLITAVTLTHRDMHLTTRQPYEKVYNADEYPGGEDILGHNRSSVPPTRQ